MFQFTLIILEWLVIVVVDGSLDSTNCKYKMCGDCAVMGIHLEMSVDAVLLLFCRQLQ
jgi:hypothetical protein